MLNINNIRKQGMRASRWRTLRWQNRLQDYGLLRRFRFFGDGRQGTCRGLKRCEHITHMRRNYHRGWVPYMCFWFHTRAAGVKLKNEREGGEGFRTCGAQVRAA
jgi:hypothetical protein